MKSLTRRQHGQGAIYQRATGQWCGSLELGRDQNGKRKRKVVYGTTERAVQRKIDALWERRSEGAIVSTADERMATFLPRWFRTLRPRAQGKYSPTPLHEYEGLIRRHLVPRLARIVVGELNADAVEALQEGMFDDGCASQTVLNARNLLRMAVKYAMRRRLLTYNPIDLVEAPP